MIERFKGKSGKRLLIEALLKQDMIRQDKNLAKKISEMGQLEEFKKDDFLIRQNATDNDIFLIINGSFNIYVNNKHIAVREKGEDVGEMAAIEPDARRSADVKARENSLVLRIKEEDFQNISKKFPVIWKNLALKISDRLRESGKRLKSPNLSESIFLGSTKESLSIAKEIKKQLERRQPKKRKIKIQPWYKDVFLPSTFNLPSLLEKATESNFAVFVLSPEDKVKSRKIVKQAPRDNIIFEIGLFIGLNGYKRTLMVKPKGLDIKIPTDLFGLNPIEYSTKKKLDVAIRPVTEEIIKIVDKLKPTKY